MVKKDSQVLQFASQNNTQGIQELFSKGEASPFDCDEDGLTPLHVCFIAGSLEYSFDNNFRSQLSNIAMTYVSYSWTTAPMPIIVLSAFGKCKANFRQVPQLMRLRRSKPLDKCACRSSWPNLEGHTKETVENVTRLLYTVTDLEADPPWYIDSRASFIMWQGHADPSYYTRSLETRISMTIKAPRLTIEDPSEHFKIMLSRGPIPPLAHTIVTSDGNSLLHVVATEIGHASKMFYDFGNVCELRSIWEKKVLGSPLDSVNEDMLK